MKNRSLPCCSVIAGAVVFLATTALLAQESSFKTPGQKAQQSPSRTGRELRQLLDQAQECCQQGDVSRTVQIVDRVLSQANQLIPGPERDLEPSHPQARKILESLGAPGVRLLREQTNAVAQKELELAWGAHDEDRLKFLVERYFYSPPAKETRWRLAQLAADRSHLLEAAGLCAPMLANSHLRPELASGDLPKIATIFTLVGDVKLLEECWKLLRDRSVTTISLRDKEISTENFQLHCRTVAEKVPSEITAAWLAHQRRFLQLRTNGEDNILATWAPPNSRRGEEVQLSLARLDDDTVVCAERESHLYWVRYGKQLETRSFPANYSQSYVASPIVLSDGKTVVFRAGSKLCWLRDGKLIAENSHEDWLNHQPIALPENRVFMLCKAGRGVWFDFGKIVGTYPLPDSAESIRSVTRSSAVLADGTVVVHYSRRSADSDRYLWLKIGNLVAEWKPPEDFPLEFTRVTFGPVLQNRLVTGLVGKRILFWKDGELVEQNRETFEDGTPICLAPWNDSTVAVGGKNGVCLVSPSATLNPLPEFAPLNKPCFLYSMPGRKEFCAVRSSGELHWMTPRGLESHPIQSKNATQSHVIEGPTQKNSLFLADHTFVTTTLNNANPQVLWCVPPTSRAEELPYRTRELFELLLK